MKKYRMKTVAESKVAHSRVGNLDDLDSNNKNVNFSWALCVEDWKNSSQAPLTWLLLPHMQTQVSVPAYCFHGCGMLWSHHLDQASSREFQPRGRQGKASVGAVGGRKLLCPIAVLVLSEAFGEPPWGTAGLDRPGLIQQGSSLYVQGFGISAPTFRMLPPELQQDQSLYLSDDVLLRFLNELSSQNLKWALKFWAVLTIHIHLPTQTYINFPVLMQP